MTDTQTETDQGIRYDVDGGIATITFNRPEKLNAVTPALSRLYLELLQRADDDAEVKAIIITGAGRAFCAGADTSQLAAAIATDQPKDAKMPPADLPSRISKPMIAAINGAAAGVGLVHALSCDVRFAAANATMTFAFSRFGLVAEFETSWQVPRLVGTGRALDLLWTSKRFSGQEAYEYGLVEYVTEPGETLDAARAYVEKMLSDLSWYSLVQIKKQVYGNWDRTRADALEHSLARMKASLTEGDIAERA